MTGSYHDPNWSEQITVPVRRVGDRWEFFYGGDVPVRDGALGHLTVGAAQVIDKAFLQRLQQPAVVKVLPEGAPLLVALSDKQNRNLPHALWERMSQKDVPAETTRLERVFLGPRRPGMVLPDDDDATPPDRSGGLWLRVKALDKTELVSSVVVMAEGCAEPTAISLNHAFTMLSERFEKHRISHTGNVYTRVFYMESDNRWYPLADLREGVLVSAERQLMANSWQAMEQKLGWRPVVRPGKKKG
jgi:hypothetical protein